MFYDSFAKELLNPEIYPERLNELLSILIGTEIDQQKMEINQQKAELAERDQKIDQQKQELATKDQALREALKRISELEAEKDSSKK